MRLDQLPENQLVSTLLGLRKRQDDFKNRQLTSGRSGLLGYMAENSGWDYDAVINTGSPSSFLDTTWTLNFTSDGTQDYPMMNPFLDIFIDTPIEANRLRPGQDTWTDGTNYVYLFSFVETDKLSVGRPTFSSVNQLQWYTVLSIAGSVHVYVKGYAAGTSGGTVTVTRTF